MIKLLSNLKWIIILHEKVLWLISTIAGPFILVSDWEGLVFSSRAEGQTEPSLTLCQSDHCSRSFLSLVHHLFPFREQHWLFPGRPLACAFSFRIFRFRYTRFFNRIGYWPNSWDSNGWPESTLSIPVRWIFDQVWAFCSQHYSLEHVCGVLEYYEIFYVKIDTR